MVKTNHFQNCFHDAAQIGRSSTQKVMYCHTQNVMQHGATGMFCSSDTVSSQITFLVFFGISLKTIHNQMCGAHIAYKQLQHSWWRQLTAYLIAGCRTTDAPSCRCNHPDEIWWAVQIVEIMFLLAAGTVHLQYLLFKIQVWQQDCCRLMTECDPYWDLRFSQWYWRFNVMLFIGQAAFQCSTCRLSFLYVMGIHWPITYTGLLFASGPCSLWTRK